VTTKIQTSDYSTVQTTLQIKVYLERVRLETSYVTLDIFCADLPFVICLCLLFNVRSFEVVLVLGIVYCRRGAFVVFDIIYDRTAYYYWLLYNI